MSLFSLDDIKKTHQVKGPSAINIVGSTRYVIGKQHQTIEELMPELPATGDAIEFVSNGDWSVHDLLFFALDKTGPANVYFTTWAISEFAIRQLYTFVNSGMITNLTGIFDFRNVTHKSAELKFLQRISPNIRPARIHAKVTVIENDQWAITIAGSGNYTRNPRIEIGTIRNSKESVNFHKSWIHGELNSRSSFSIY